jgi:hypothetical protein
LFQTGLCVFLKCETELGFCSARFRLSTLERFFSYATTDRR